MTTAHVLDVTGDTGRLVMSKSGIAKTCGQMHAVVMHAWWCLTATTLPGRGRLTEDYADIKSWRLELVVAWSHKK